MNYTEKEKKIKKSEILKINLLTEKICQEKKLT